MTDGFDFENIREAVDGVWVDMAEYDPLYGDFRVKVRPLDNPEQRAFYNRLMKPHYKRARDGVPDMEVIEVMRRRSVAHHVVTDWENGKRGGEPLPYTPENCEDTFKSFERFYRHILKIASEEDRFLVCRQEELKGN